MREIKFKDKTYLLIGTKEGAITTKRQYENGFCSYAHLYENGSVKRFNKIIGTIKDIKFRRKIKDIMPKSGAFYNMLSHPSWPFNRDF